jgi:hypothetical protein
MLTIVFSGIILILLCIWIAWKRFEFCHIMSAVPGPKAWPVVGNALQLKRDPHGRRYLESITKILGFICSFLPIVTVSIFLAFVRSLVSLVFVYINLPWNSDYICFNLQARHIALVSIYYNLWFHLWKAFSDLWSVISAIEAFWIGGGGAEMLWMIFCPHFERKYTCEVEGREVGQWCFPGGTWGNTVPPPFLPGERQPPAKIKRGGTRFPLAGIKYEWRSVNTVWHHPSEHHLTPSK